MFILDRLLVGGLVFVLDKIGAVADREMNDPAALQEALLAAQMRLELGEISDEDFRAVEREVVRRLREIHERREGEEGETGTYRVTGVDTTFDE